MRKESLFGTEHSGIKNQDIKILVLMITVLFYILAVEESISTDAPVNPASKRIIIVAQDGSGEYTSIQTALNNSQPGDTIQVKNGTYDESLNFAISGTKQLPITLMSYPGHDPVIRPGSSKNLADVKSGENVVVNAEWVLIDGFEITNSWHGFRINKPHVTVQNNRIHHNSQSGIFTLAAHLLIKDNIVEWNGVETCTNKGKISPRHCHGMYINNNASEKVSFLTISGNTVSSHGGNGIMLKSAHVNTGHRQNLIEDNLIENNAQNGIALYKNITQSDVLNNTVIIISPPPSNAGRSSLVSINNSTINTYKDNIFHTTLTTALAFDGVTKNCDKNTFDYNTWSVAGSKWRWKGDLRNDFKENYQSVTGWDVNGTIE